MILKITKPYLWFPVLETAEEKKLHFYIEEKKVQEIDIHLGNEKFDFYTFWDVRDYLGKEMEICGADQEALQYIFGCEEIPQNIYPFRPKLHFAPERGWHNDPNGMVYADGVYHLYFQWNPYGTVWGNMHWGHAKSRDLYHWEWEGMALAPNENGTMYSGCGIQDTENLLGYGKEALLFYYTAAGGRNQWSIDAGNLFTQRLAYSVDGGKTLLPSDKFFMPHVVNENRDPKVFYHEASQAYVMALYLDGNEFAIYRSENLKDWTQTQRFSIPGMWECPDLFELEVENAPGERQWVFWSADGFYVIGDFDGYVFTPKSKRRSAYSSDLAYAAQTFSGTPGRVISMAWLRMENNRGNYRSLMSLPMVLSLRKEGEDYRMCFAPAHELETLAGEWKEVCGEEFSPNGRAVELMISASKELEGYWEMMIGTRKITADFYEGIFSISDVVSHTYYVRSFFDKKKQQEFRMIIDQEVVEFLGENGTIYGIAEMPENILGMTWQIKKSEGSGVVCRRRFFDSNE